MHDMTVDIHGPFPFKFDSSNYFYSEKKKFLKDL